MRIIILHLCRTLTFRKDVIVKTKKRKKNEGKKKRKEGNGEE